MVEIHHRKLCLSLICLSLFCPKITGIFMSLPSSAELGPRRPWKLQEGQQLKIWCHLTNETWQRSCNASNMSIRLNKHQNRLYVLGTQTPTDEYNITMVIEKTTVNESGTYYCYCHDTAVFASYILTVTIQAPPVEPENITIILEDFDTLLVGFNPVRNSSSLNDKTTTWSLQISSPYDQSTWTTCKATNDKYWCERNDTQRFRYNSVNVTIQVSNEIGSSNTTREVELFHYVRLTRRHVQAVANRTWVYLNWTLPDQVETFWFRGLHYMLVFSSQLFPPHVVNRTCLSETAAQQEICERMEEIVEGLHPDTTYNATLRSHPVVGGYWSAPAEFTFSTLEDVPRAGPGIHPWLYTTVWSHNRKTLIYPQELKPQDRSGKIIAYEYWMEGWQSNRREKGTPHLLSVDSYKPDGPALTVRLWACTSVGCSQNFSSITLPGGGNGVPGPGWLDVEKVNASFYHLFWEDLALQPPTSVQLHWCWGEVQSHSQSSLVFCKTNVNSREVNSTANSALLSVSQTEDACWGIRDCSVQFGISVERDGASSGIIWNTCIFIQGQKPEQVSEVFVDRRKAPHELTLTWDYPCHISLDNLNGRPIQFETRLGPSTASEINTTTCDRMQGPSQISEGKHGENRHQFQDLGTGVPYLICVRSLSLPSQPWREGQWAVKSEPPFVTDSNLRSALGISLSIVAAVLVMIVAALCLVRWKYKEKKLPINTDFFRERYEAWPVPVNVVPESEDLPQWTPPSQQQESVVGATEVSQESVTTSCPQEDPQTDRSKYASDSGYHFQLHFPEGNGSTGQQMETPDSSRSSPCYNYTNDAYSADMEDAVNGLASTKEEETTAVEVKKGKVLIEPSKLEEGGLSWDMTNGVVSFDSSGKSSSDHDPHYIRSGHRLSGGSVELDCSHPSVV